MNYIVAKNIDDNTYLMTDIHGEARHFIDEQTFNRLKYKLSVFDKNKIALYSNGTCVRNSVTVLARYYYSSRKEVKYFVCDDNLNKISMSKQDIQRAYSTKSFSNIRVCSDGSIRALSGSIPFLQNASNLMTDNTVIKLGGINEITPGLMGVSKKFFGKRVSDGKVGCVKFELFPNSYDIRNEVLAYKLGKLLNFDVVEATFEKFDGSNCIISIYNYDMRTEKISSLKSEIGTDNFHARFNKNWFIKNKSREAFEKFMQMVMLDLMMHQTDRHISNIAFKGDQLYSLYDNGRALFYDTFVKGTPEIDLTNRGKIVESFYLNEHGYTWTYLEDVLGYENYKHLIRHDLTYEDFFKIVKESYGDSDKFRNSWVTEYMYKVYLIITRQERKWDR